MILKRIFRSIFLIMLICNLLIAAGLDTAVICHAEDGHTAIEAATGSNCAKLPAIRPDRYWSSSTESQVSSSDDCGDCLDVPVSIGPAAIVKKNCKIHASAAIWISVAVMRANAADATRCPWPTQFVLPPPCLGPLESVVLLI